MDIDEKEYRQQLVHLSQLDGPVHYAEIWLRLICCKRKQCSFAEK